MAFNPLYTIPYLLYFPISIFFQRSYLVSKNVTRYAKLSPMPLCQYLDLS